VTSATGRQLTLRIGPDTMHAAEAFLTDRGADGLEAQLALSRSAPVRAATGSRRRSSLRISWPITRAWAAGFRSPSAESGSWQPGFRQAVVTLPGFTVIRVARSTPAPMMPIPRSLTRARSRSSCLTSVWACGAGSGVCAVYKLTAGRWMPTKPRADGNDWVIGSG
jgi:hypothetical protein